MLAYLDTKIYILCPANFVSDTAELCHKLCSKILLCDANVQMAYIPAENFNPTAPIANDYKKFHLPYTFDVEDSTKNILIVPEIFCEYLYAFKKIRRVIFWTTTDNFLKNISLKIFNHMNKILSAPVPKIFYFHADDMEIEHWTASEYARQFLSLNGISEGKIYRLADSLDAEILSAAKNIDFDAKEDVVAFNFAGNSKILMKLLELLPDFEWCSVKNLTTDSLKNIFLRAKIYIDFTDHVGRTKLPRIAESLGCVVMTNKRGAAANDFDINIPHEFKFDENDADLLDVAEKILHVMNHFPEEIAKQTNYFEKILDDENRCLRNLTEILGIRPSEKNFAALVNDSRGTAYELAEIFYTDNEIVPSFVVDDVVDDYTQLLPQNVNENADGKIFYHLSNGQKISVISSSDAKFLYGEGRIKIFVFPSTTGAEMIELQKKINPAVSDVIDLQVN